MVTSHPSFWTPSALADVTVMNPKYISYFGRNIKVKMCGLTEGVGAWTDLNVATALPLTYDATLGRLTSSCLGFIVSKMETIHILTS